MRYAGIDIGSEKHYVAIVDAEGALLRKAKAFTEDAAGYETLKEVLGDTEVLVCMEATGHYWKNLHAMLTGYGYQVSVVNALRTSRFMEQDLSRTKTDAIDAVGIARFAAQKKPAVTKLPDDATEELKALVRLRDGIVQEMGDKTRRLRQMVDLGFPEFVRSVKSMDSELATTILGSYPSAASLKSIKPTKLAELVYDGRHQVGLELATELIESAKKSVGSQHSDVHKLKTGYLCADIATLRTRLKSIDKDIRTCVDNHEIAKLVVEIEGIGHTTAARVIATFGNPADFTGPKAMAAFAALAPSIKQSGKRSGIHRPLSNIGDVHFRTMLWLPTLVATSKNPWIKAFYDRLIASGKPPKVAVIAAMRKLLIAIHWVAKHKRTFDPLRSLAEVAT